MLTSTFILPVLALAHGVSGTLRNIHPRFHADRSDSTLGKRDWNRIDDIYERMDAEYKDGIKDLPDLSKCMYQPMERGAEWTEYFDNLPEPCRRTLTVGNDRSARIIEEHGFGEGKSMSGSDLDAMQDDIRIRGQCLSATFDDVQEAAVQCQKVYCPEGTAEGDAIDKVQSIYISVMSKWCPALLHEWKSVIEEGYTRTSTKNIVIYPVTVDGKKVTTTIETTTATTTASPITLPESAWDIMTHSKFTGTIPTETSTPTASATGEEEEEDNVRPKESKPADSGASGLRTVGTGSLLLVTGWGFIWATLGFF